MSRKFFAAGLVLSVLTLGGCSFNSAEGNEQVSEIVSAAASAAVSQRAETESTSAATTSVTSATESEASEPTETEPPYIEDGKPPEVMSAEELYDTYPVKLIYPERQDVSDKVKTEVLQEDIYNSDGLLMVKFYAEYPVISGYDEAVCKRINDEIHGCIYGTLEDEREWAEWYEVIDGEENFMYKNYGRFLDVNINMEGTYFDGFGYDINGNIFTVYFAYNGYSAGAVHGSEEPEPMMFDLRTGDKIIFSELIGDKDKMNEAFAKTECRGELMHGEVPCGKLDADRMAEVLKDDAWINNTLEGISLYSYIEDERIMVIDGCIGFLLAPYESGSFADGVRFWHLPASEFVPYMNEKGKSLFEGYISAETTAPNVIEYKGKRWFDNVEWIPEFVDRKNLTDYDREFILMFENARNVNYYLNNE